MANIKSLLNVDDFFDGGRQQDTNIHLIREGIQEIRKDNVYDFIETNYDILSKEDLRNFLMSFITLVQENELDMESVAENLELIYFQS